jgi:hypothetical protein
MRPAKLYSEAVLSTMKPDPKIVLVNAICSADFISFLLLEKDKAKDRAISRGQFLKNLTNTLLPLFGLHLDLWIWALTWRVKPVGDR